MEYRQLKNNLKNDFTAFPKKKVAILGDSPTQLLTIALKGYGFESQFNYDIYEADFNQIEMQVFTPDSELYQFAPEFIVLYYSSENLYLNFSKLSDEEKCSFSEDFLAKITSIYAHLKSINANVIFINFCTIDDGVFGNFANKTVHSFIFQIRKLNFEIMKLATENPKFFIADFDLLQSVYGLDFRRKESTYINTGIITDINFVPHLAAQLNSIILAVVGKFKKCVILDLDNTLWGGIIGDDGIENIQIGNLGIGKAFYEFQLWIKQLKNRGIIIAICSKNELEIAQQPFLEHPEMVLKLEDIAVFIANWDMKADNIRHIQSILNIGFDSMVFIDDNPFERNFIKKELPEITVPDLPDDPAEYLKFLKKQHLFETASLSNEDGLRTEKYQQEAKRNALQRAFSNEEEYLKSLAMEMSTRTFTKFNLPRVAQLSQRSNQYNLTTVRYDEALLADIILNPDYFTFAFSLRDIYGDYGLISLVLLKSDRKSLYVESWIMSCRVLNRTVEKLVLNKLVALAKAKGFKTLVGTFIPSPKNKMVQFHYKSLGFSELGDGKWELQIDNYLPMSHYINEQNE